MTFPRLQALQAAWRLTPPAAVTLRRLAQWCGLPDPEPSRASRQGPFEQTPKDELMRQLGAMGVPIHNTRPNDPMLDLCGY